MQPSREGQNTYLGTARPRNHMIGTLFESTWLLGLIASLLFSGLLLIHHFFGPGPDVRDENGKKQILPEHRTFVIIEMIAMITLLIGASSLGVLRFNDLSPGAGALAQITAAYLVMWFVNLWDFVVIDWALLIRFRPRWLIVPETEYYTSVRPHFTGWLLAHLYMIPPAILAWSISRWLQN